MTCDLKTVLVALLYLSRATGQGDVMLNVRGAAAGCALGRSVPWGCSWTLSKVSPALGMHLLFFLQLCSYIYCHVQLVSSPYPPN